MASNKDLEGSSSMEDETTQNKGASDITQKDDDDIVSLICAEHKKYVTDICTKHMTKRDHPVMIDLQNKMGIVYNVLKACIMELSDNTYYHTGNIRNRLTFLTNMHKDFVSNIMQNIKTKKTYIFEESVLESPDTDFLIRQTLIKYYVNSNIIPRTEFLKNIIHNHCYNYELNQQLKISGYIWHRLPKTKRAIIIEHPKRVMERQRYLQQIIRARKEKRPIIYVESKVLSKADKNFVKFRHCLTEDTNYVMLFIAVDNVKGFIGGHIFVCKSIFRCQKLIEEHLIKNYIPNVTEPSLIILEDKTYYTKSLPVPSIESEKSEMIKWLKINKIPHEENLHRSELFELIERCKTKGDLHNFDADLHVYGHKILRRPPRTDYLNFYKPLWETRATCEDVTTFIGNQNLIFWQNCEAALKNMEKLVYSEDTEMEKIIDQILTMANNVDVSEWANNECDVEGDSLAQDEFIVEYKNSSSQDDFDERERQFLSEINKLHGLPEITQQIEQSRSD